MKLTWYARDAVIIRVVTDMPGVTTDTVRCVVLGEAIKITRLQAQSDLRSLSERGLIVERDGRWYPVAAAGQGDGGRKERG